MNWGSHPTSLLPDQNCCQKSVLAGSYKSGQAIRPQPVLRLYSPNAPCDLWSPECSGIPVVGPWARQPPVLFDHTRKKLRVHARTGTMAPFRPQYRRLN